MFFVRSNYLILSIQEWNYLLFSAFFALVLTCIPLLRPSYHVVAGAWALESKCHTWLMEKQLQLGVCSRAERYEVPDLGIWALHLLSSALMNSI